MTTMSRPLLHQPRRLSILPWLLVLSLIGFTPLPPAAAQEIADPIVDEPYRAAFDQAWSDYQEVVRPLREGLAEGETEARGVYTAGLEELERELIQREELNSAAGIRREIDTVTGGRGLAPLTRDSLRAFRQLRDTYDQTVAGQRREVERDIREARAEYLRTLRRIETAAANAGHSDTVATMRFEALCIRLAEAADQGRFSTTHSSQVGFIVRPEDGGILIGLKYARGSWYQHTVISRVQPVFLTGRGVVLGPEIGRGPLNHEVLAPAGYAIGKMTTRRSDRVFGFSVSFYPFDPSRTRLESRPEETTAWQGAPQNRAEVHDSRGDFVIGIEIVQAPSSKPRQMGLVYCRP